MIEELDQLFANNRRWATETEALRPGFFSRLARQQNPRYMWIGCADSRVSANEIMGLDPGEVFVHRNVANLVVPSDLNALSTIQFAVEHLNVEHIMVVGHHGCAGVRTALHGKRMGLTDNWLRHIQDVRLRYRKRLEHLPPNKQEDTLCEMNVIEQVDNVALCSVVQDAWARRCAWALPNACTTCASRRSAPACMSTGWVQSHTASMRIAAAREARLHNRLPPKPAM